MTGGILISRHGCLPLYCLVLACYFNSLTPAYGQDIPTQEQLLQTVEHLSVKIGPRNIQHYAALTKAADWIETELSKNSFKVERQDFKVASKTCSNLIAEIKGKGVPEEIVIVGAHYDSAGPTPGANDNASGVAALLAISHKLANLQPKRTLRFVAFANEEPPYFQRENQMGSWVYARACRKNGDNIVAVLSLETMGYFTDAPKSQNYPAILAPFYPSTGNFLGFVSNRPSRAMVQDVLAKFKAACPSVPAESASLPEDLQGVGWSDHWSFWQEGYPGIMVTDTALFRYKHYHKMSDTPDKLNYAVFATCVDALAVVIEQLANEDKQK